MGDNNNSSSNSSMKSETNQETVNIKSRSWTGYAFALLSAVFVSFGALCIKLYEGEKLKISLLRCLGQYITLLPTITIKKLNLWGTDSKKTTLLLLRGLFGGIAMSAVTLSIDFLPLGDAVAITYAYPALVFFFACIFLKEKCGFLNIVLTIITVIGLIMVAQPSFLVTSLPDAKKTVPESHRIIGVLLGIVAALSIAFITILIRKLGPGIHFSVSLFHYSWEGGMLVLVYLAITGNLIIPCLKELPIMVVGSTALYLGQIFTTMALQRERAGPVSLIKASEVLFSFVFQYFALGVVPSILSVIGAALILSCTIVISIKSIWKSVKFSQ